MGDLVEPNFKTRKASPQRKRKAAKRREMSASARIVAERSGGRCEICGERRHLQVHHKAGRRVPGANHPSLLLHLCLFCHSEVHANPEHSYREGHLIRPSTVGASDV